MGGKSLFGYLVHAVGAYLHLYPSSLLAHQRDVQSLIAIGFGVVEPIAQAVGVRLVDAAYGDVNLETLVDFLFSDLGREDDTYGKEVIDFFEGDVLGLHLVPYRVWALDAGDNLVFHPSRIEGLPDGGGEFFEELVALLLGEVELVGDVGVLLGVLELETEVLELGLDFVETQAVGQGGVDVQGLACYLVLLVGGLRLEGSHVVESVADFDEDDPYVVAHGEQQFLEVLCLCRGMVAEDASTDFG